MNKAKLEPLLHRPAVPAEVLAHDMPWRSSGNAKKSTYDLLCERLGIEELSEKQKHQVDEVYKDLRVPMDWKPDMNPAHIHEAHQLCFWAGNPKFRLKVYGEFSQYLNPDVEFTALEVLKESEKKDAEICFTKAAVRHDLFTDLDRIRNAIADFALLYPRISGNFEGAGVFLQQLKEHDERIDREMEERWSEHVEETDP